MAAPTSEGATRGLLTIGDVAERTGLSLRSIRHYEDVGVLPESARSPGGFRLCADGTIHRLLVVMGMKPLGFTIEQMREALGALDRSDLTSHDAEAQIELLADYQQQVRVGIGNLRARLASAEALDASLATRLARAANTGEQDAGMS